MIAFLDFILIFSFNTKNLLKSHVFMLQKSYQKSLPCIKSFKITAWYINDD